MEQITIPLQEYRYLTATVKTRQMVIEQMAGKLVLKDKRIKALLEEIERLDETCNALRSGTV